MWTFLIPGAHCSRRPLMFWSVAVVILAFGLAKWLGVESVSNLKINVQLGHVVLSLILLVSLFSIPRAQLELKVRLFWFCLTLAFSVWLLTKIALVTAQWAEHKAWITHAADYGYFAFFLISVFSLLFYASANKKDKKTIINQYGALFFVTLLFVYLVLLPKGSGTLDESSYPSSFLFFILMDIYLALAFWANGVTSNSFAWRVRFYAISLSFCIFFVQDLLEILMATDLISFRFRNGLEMFWFIPYLTFALALQHPINDKPVSRGTLSTRLPPPLIFSLASLPVVHALGHSLGIFNPEYHDVRELIMLFWILVYVVFVTVSQRRIRHFDTAEVESVSESEVSEDDDELEIDHIPMAYFSLDLHGHILASNRSAVGLVGYSNEKMQGQFFSALLAKDEPLEPLLRFTESSFLQSGLVTNKVHDITLQHANGKVLNCFAAFSSIDEKYIAVNLVDVTSLRNAEDQALAIKDKFLANITHEFRTPLTIIQGAIDEGVASIDDPTLKQRLQAAKVNTVRVLKMVEQLLTLSKITSAPKLDKTVQPISEIVRVTCTQFAPICEQKNIRFDTNIVNGLWGEIHDDSLQQILYNLLSNAYKYSERDGEIKLYMHQRHSAVELSVSDKGVGIGEEEQQRLFERFQRSDNVKKSATFGVGIGLSLISELADSHDWKLSVFSKLGEGSTFSISIPLCEAPEVEEQSVKEVDFEVEALAEQRLSIKGKQGLETVSIPSEKTNRLLIVEDNLDMQDYLRHLMEPYYMVDIVGRGSPAIEQAKQDIPDIIICDLMLPDISGYEVVEALKNDDLTSHIPILMLTAKSDIKSKLEGLSRKADDYLTKPFNYEELQLRLQNLLGLREKVQCHLQQSLLKSAATTALKVALPEVNEEFNVTPHAQFLEKLQAIAEAHYADETFSLSAFASEIALSERQLQRKLNAALNMTPGEYLREFRLIKAKELLLQNMPIGHVAENVGFSSQAYFTKCFKQSFECTPSEFQKQSTSQ